MIITRLSMLSARLSPLSIQRASRTSSKHNMRTRGKENTKVELTFGNCLTRNDPQYDRQKSRDWVFLYNYISPYVSPWDKPYFRVETVDASSSPVVVFHCSFHP